MVIEDSRTIQEHSDFLRRNDQFLQEIKPIVTERIKLQGMFDSMVLFPDGHIEYHYPPAVKKLDDQYNNLTIELQKYIFGQDKQNINQKSAME